MINKRLLTFCILISLSVHGLFLLFIRHHSVWFVQPLDSRPAQASVSQRKQAILKETFLALTKKEPTSAIEPKTIANSESFSQELPPFHNTPAAHHPRTFTQSKLIYSTPTFSTISPSHPSKLELNLPELMVLTHPQPKEIHAPVAFPRQHLQTASMSQLNGPHFEPLQMQLVHPDRTPTSMDLVDQNISRKPLLTIPNVSMPSFPTLNELETSIYSDYFDLDLVCLPKEKGPGYLFAVTLLPRADLNLPKLRQQYYFLIDRANSIQKDRLSATKNAVLKALEMLAPDDTFNIIAFDSKVDKLFSCPKSPDVISISQAKIFLDQVNLGSFFAPADLYNPLLLTLPNPVRDDEVNTAILLTDGENLSKKSSIRAILQAWTRQNNGAVSLFTVGMNNDPQKSTLHLTSAFNRGQFFGSPTQRGLKRKLLKLMQNIQTPLAKNITVRGISKSQNSSIELHAGFRTSPHMYLDQPFVIIGQCDANDEFILFVQGRLKDRWMNIKKNISFINAKKGGTSLLEEWAVQKAFQAYESYVQDNNPHHLTEAENVLRPYHIQPAFR